MKLILILLFVISNAVYAHGNIDNKHGACTLKISKEHAIHLTAYQPSTHEGEVYCQDAPDLVETTIVLDFMEEDLKKRPFSFSMAYMNGKNVEPLTALPLQLYPQGSMLLKFTPEVVGVYQGKVMFLDEDGHDSSREFNFYIGERSPNSSAPSSAQTVIKWLIVMMFVLGGVYVVYTKWVNKERDAD
ncbi:MAG: hypothetical protein COB26_08900 [Piscirickettsiaceae bacterium]|nr:MAG: hypothetical protein COB89_03030 [Piscirickettsiaceae bacterium]PCI68081.1 MAG: hypothetical protein COB26_08900 [Piscirickettsiaceae bacterium]